MADSSEQDKALQLYEVDRALLDEHGLPYIDTICSFAEGMRAEGRTADADEAMRQCDRMRAILLSDRDLVAHYHAVDGEGGDPWSDALVAEVERRGLDT
ncbi:hypothetical protein [Sphingomonas endolithica]|uniref:hypothetical protein n=1 Tax=Sphingomonas endolithica TaxID=2972485 RepID=UPI0021AE3A9C|nr:hypothetical protein [Sphingomonas sp. ZFBP2030]